MEIVIQENGPYIVKGGVPLREMRIRSQGKGYIWEEGNPLPQKEVYTLCRCGRSSTPPFCDGAHKTIAFAGKETASRKPFMERARRSSGPEMDLMDDGRCAFSRFCHRQGGDAWSLAESRGAEDQKEAVLAAAACPSGRLLALDKRGKEYEPRLKKEIIIIQDPERNVSGGIYVKGGIPLIGADGASYPLQNRYVLCRCGLSKNKPFCDARHMSGFLDGLS